MSLTVSDLVSLLALAVAAASLGFARREWHASNRPLVSAFIEVHDAGNRASTFDLVIANTGNRPATDIKLMTDPERLATIFAENVSSQRLERVTRIFDRPQSLVLLRNGEQLSTSFGAVTHPDDNQPWLKHGALLRIQIYYADLEGRRRYQSNLVLRIGPRDGFGGGMWSLPYQRRRA